MTARPAGRLGALAAALVLALGIGGAPAAAEEREAPTLTELVEAGSLPPLAERLPAEPLVDEMNQEWRELGRYGGDLTMLMAKARDLRQLTVYGYARLVGFDMELNLVPDILLDVENDRDLSFTLHLRPGHRWSDGAPFTTEDFRYWWEDIANNEELTPAGVPAALLVDGKPPTIEILSETSIRYTWPTPNPTFLHKLGQASPLYIYAPAHYLKPYHADYRDAAELEAEVEAHSARSWAALHNKLDDAYKQSNAKLPSLQPWTLKDDAPAERYVFERNPYFHRVDSKGRQLPYIDRVIVNLASSGLIAAKTGAGESDLQARYLRFDNYTFLKEASGRQDFDVLLWRSARGAQYALYPNLTIKDPTWRELFRDVRFRRALSLAVDRFEINQVVYFGLAIEGNNTVLPKSPLFKPAYRKSWAEFDLDKANTLLDEMGLTERDGEGLRLGPNGEPLVIVVESAGESTEETDILQLIAETWRKIGIKLLAKPLQREVLLNRIYAGDSQMAIWFGLQNALPGPLDSPEELAPVKQEYLQWARWGQHYETKGRSGEEVDMTGAQDLMELYRNWFMTPVLAEREIIWHRMLDIHANNVYSIGIVAGVPQPVVAAKSLKNLPKEGLYNWDPGSFFGLYHLDSLWWDK